MPSKDKNSSSMGRGQSRPWGKRGARVTYASSRALHVAPNKTTGDASTSTRHRGKAGAHSRAQEAVGPSKRNPTEKGKNPQSPKLKQAQCVLNENGLYEVRVDYSHCLNLAQSTGVDPAMVIQTVREDNNQRMEQATSSRNLTEEEFVDQRTRFDPDSGDELDSEFE